MHYTTCVSVLHPLTLSLLRAAAVPCLSRVFGRLLSVADGDYMITIAEALPL